MVTSPITFIHFLQHVPQPVLVRNTKTKLKISSNWEFFLMSLCWLEHFPDELLQLITTQYICCLPFMKIIHAIRVVMCINKRWYRITRTCPAVWEHFAKAFGLGGTYNDQCCRTAEIFATLWHNSKQTFSIVPQGPKLVLLVAWCDDKGSKTHPLFFSVKPRRGPFDTAISVLVGFRCFCCGHKLGGPEQVVLPRFSMQKKMQKTAHC